MSKRIYLLAGMAAALALHVTLPATLSAQESPTDPNAACMARSDGGPDAAVFVIKVPQRVQGQMAARGYALQQCSGDQAAFLSYRDRVCYLSNSAPAVVHEQFTQKHNASAKELCDLAMTISEQYDIQ